MSDTPETDASEMPIDRVDSAASRPCCVVNANFARKLERERDKALAALKTAHDSLEMFATDETPEGWSAIAAVMEARSLLLSETEKYAEIERINTLSKRFDARLHGAGKTAEDNAAVTEGEETK